MIATTPVQHFRARGFFMSDVEQFAMQPKPPEEATATLTAENGKPNNKKIVVCCDGTGNEFAGVNSENSNSNVVKLYTALKLNNQQIAYYHPGVGTMGDPTKAGVPRKWSVIKGLAFGQGFEENVLDAYRYLMQHYNSGDTVYLIGFSRGAYTARALAGLLQGYGLLCRGNEGHIPYAWRMYTQQMQDQRQQNRHTIATDYSFRDTFSHKDFMLHFVGLWDTVSSVGWISTPLRLLHLAQNPIIVTGRHAISIDERRCFFVDNLWGEPVDVEIPAVLCGTARENEIPKMQDILQVWFAGVHSDVGGSYPQLKSGLSNITLKWMMDEAKAADIVFDPIRRNVVLGEPPTPAEDPCGLTAGIAPLYEKPLSSPLHNSLTLPWWLLEVFPHRYYDRDDSHEKMRIPLAARRRLHKGALVHSSVRDRLQEKVCYRPPNVSLEEIQTPASTPGCYVFEPIKCREGGWRENWLLVFTVSVLEIALGLFLLAHLLLWGAECLVWLLQRFDWLGHHALAKTDYSNFAAMYGIVRAWTQRVRSTHSLWILRRFWPLIVAAIVVIWRFLVATARRVKT
jgi:uncharacterized protein (DUF2235 family)